MSLRFNPKKARKQSRIERLEQYIRTLEKIAERYERVLYIAATQQDGNGRYTIPLMAHQVLMEVKRGLQ